MAEIDTSEEAVERQVQALWSPYKGDQKTRDEAADMLRALRARLTEVKGRANALFELNERVTDAGLAVREKVVAAEARATAAEERCRVLEEALRWYADQFCEHSPHYEGCGKLTDYNCAGCRARQALGTDVPSHGAQP